MLFLTIFPLSSSWGLSCQNVFKVHVYEPVSDITLPSRDTYSKPRGGRTKAGKEQQLQLENLSARILTNLGFDLIQNPDAVKGTLFKNYYRNIRRNEALDHNKSPDYLVEGRVFDHYAPSSPTLQGVVNGIISKIVKLQTHRIILNLMNNEGFLSKQWNLKDLEANLKEIDNGRLWEVIVIFGTKSNPRVSTVHPEYFRHN